VTGTSPTTATSAPSFRLGYRPGLDGIRALGIVLVVIFHSLTILTDRSGTPGWRPFRGGSIGVDVFFTLSGFLITSLLLEEWRAHQSISVRRFYARRALRMRRLAGQPQSALGHECPPGCSSRRVATGELWP
jgi:peptidoglycan/LPS O-acetylase OafA/YrhL